MSNNKDNLKQFTSEQSRDEAVKNGKKGGVASGIARRERKALREQFEILLSLPLKDKEIKKKLKKLGITTDEMDNQMAMVISMWNKALHGDIKAFNSIRDLLGEKPPENINVNSNPFSELTTDELRKLISSDT